MTGILDLEKIHFGKKSNVIEVYNCIFFPHNEYCMHIYSRSNSISTDIWYSSCPDAAKFYYIWVCLFNILCKFQGSPWGEKNVWGTELIFTRFLFRNPAYLGLSIYFTFHQYASLTFPKSLREPLVSVCLPYQFLFKSESLSPSPFRMFFSTVIFHWHT